MLRVNSSVPIAQLGLFVSVERSYHISEVMHADVQAGRWSEQAGVEGFLNRSDFLVFSAFFEGLAVLIFGVTPVHGVNRLLAGQEGARLFLEHFRVT